jgi:hypothetical protein
MSSLVAYNFYQSYVDNTKISHRDHNKVVLQVIALIAHSTEEDWSRLKLVLKYLHRTPI